MNKGGTKVEHPWVYWRSEIIIIREVKENKRGRGINMGKRRGGEGREATVSLV